MEKEFKKFIEGVKEIKLSPEEKQKMREDLLLFIEKHPLEKRSGLPLFSSIFGNQLRVRTMPVMAVATVAVLAVSGGTSLAAESALPGDFLYPVKVGVNEEVRGALALSDEAEARLAARLAERRLQEATELAIEGRLTTEARGEIESRFDKHVSKFEEKANKLAAKGRANRVAEISSDLEATLKAHGEVIASVSGKTEGEPLLTTIQVKLGNVQKTRIDAEIQVSRGTKADVEAAAKGKLTAATNKIAEVRGAIERNRGSVSAETTAFVEIRLRFAEEAVVEGKAKLEAGAFAEAFASFDQAHRLAQEAQLLINASQRFKIDLDSSKKYEGCPVPRPAMPNWICPDGTTAGPICEDGRWLIKQCPSTGIGTSTLGL